MTKQEEIREGIAKRKLDVVTRCETRLIHSLSPKVQKQIGHEPYTWETIPLYLKFFWLDEADKEMKELHSQGVVIKVDREYIGCDGIGSMGIMSKDCVLLKAGYLAAGPLIGEG